MSKQPKGRAPAKPFEYTRQFASPRARVWQAWSQAGELQRWWGPKGCTLTVHGLEFRAGGFFHYAMTYSKTPPMWGRFMYREIADMQRIVWLNSFSNAGCGITRAPFGTDFPLEVLNTVTFTDRAGGTLVALQAMPFGATDSERAVFDEMFASMEQGYGGTMDQLTAHLAA